MSAGRVSLRGTEALIRRDARSGDVVLSPVKAVSWAAFAALREQLAEELAAEGLEDYLKNRQQPMDGPQGPLRGLDRAAQNR